MAILKTPSKPDVQARKNQNINKYFKSKTIYDAPAFFEGYFKIILANAPPQQEYGYSKPFNPLNKAELREAQESAYLNAVTKVAYREGYLVQESEDVIDIDNSLIVDNELIDYYFYYPDFKGEEIVSYKRKLRDGKVVTVNRRRVNGKFASGFGGENNRDELIVRGTYDKREADLSRERERAKRRADTLKKAEDFK